ncbi:MAG TPA: DinB family protein [Anaerolineales bacterium]|nr:DinB family protein [Anaerolineales bacterium]HNA55905.1 DinB family protein [Anaerolineales bacterium]HNB87312.1 DinB family protein [Anaerolineales bacterium]
MNQQERNEKIELYGRGYELLKAALAEVPAEAMQFKPDPKEWSVHEIIVHIADSESNAALRARKLIVEPGGTIMGYDQDLWATSLKYHEHSMEDALETTRLVRKTTYELLKRQPEEVFAHFIKHPEYPDPYTFEKWINIYSGHIPGHIEQIQNNVKLWKKSVG